MRLEVELGATVLEFGAIGTSHARPWLRSVGTLRVAARAGGTGATEASTLTVLLDNAAGQAARVLDVPLRRMATVFDVSGAEFFRGTVQRVRPGQGYELTIESGGAARLLSEPLPMRTTRDLGDFAADAPIPYRLGDLRAARFPLLRLSDTEFLVAGHPFDVEEVFVDGDRTLAWESALRTDAKGNRWQVVIFGAPLGNDAKASATGQGDRDPDTGALIENPADLMEYVAALGGVDLIFPVLRAQCAAEGIRLAGSIDEPKSIGTWIDSIAYSAGAIWTPSDATLYPGSTGAIIDLTSAVAGGLDDPIAELADSADVLRVAYDRSDAAGRAQAHLELSASPQRFGGVLAEVELPWVRVAANAEAIGRRLLTRMAAKRFSVELTVEDHTLRPCRQVRLVDSPEWQIPGEDPTLMVLTVEVAADAGAARATGEALLSTPSIAVTAHSLALPDTTEGGVDVDFRDGVATFTVRDEDGKPLAGARVSMDGSAPRTTDQAGRVSFATRAGRHELLVEVPGFATNRVEFDL